MDGMTILSIEIVNNRKVRLFRKTLNGDNLEVAGDTGTGKSTAVSALWDILEKRGDSLTHGQTNGHVQIKIGSTGRWIVAQRRNTPKTSSIAITDQEGQAVSIGSFKAMISDLSVNPHKIIDMKPLEQAATLLKSAELDVDLEALDKELAELEAKRLDAGRKAEALKPGDPPEKADFVSVASLVAQRDRAQEANRTNEKHRKNLQDLKEAHEEDQTEAEKLGVEILQLRARLKTLEGAIATRAARIEKGKAFVKALQDIDVSPITASIATAEETNRKAALYATWKEGSRKYEEAAKTHSDLDVRLKRRRSDRKAAMDQARWPLPGLSVQDGQVLYNGSLLSNLGTSEQKLVCAAIAMKDILDHPLRVVRMDGVESMSRKDFDRLKELFNGHGIQVLSTRVARGDVESNEIELVEGVYEEVSA